MITALGAVAGVGFEALLEPRVVPHEANALSVCLSSSTLRQLPPWTQGRSRQVPRAFPGMDELSADVTPILS